MKYTERKILRGDPFTKNATQFSMAFSTFGGKEMRRWFESFILILTFVMISAVSGNAADRVFKVLLDSGKIFSVLNVSASGKDGTSTKLNVEDCPEFNAPIFEGAFRFEVELALICNVLRDNDLADRLEFVGYPNLRRAMADLRSSNADFIGESVFSTEVEQGVRSTKPVISKGDFQVGIFTTPGRSDVQRLTNPKELQSLIGITVQYWLIDKKTLEGMGIKAVVTARKMEQIPRMIDSGRADFTLSFLDRPTTEHMGRTLTRVDGFRVSLVDERVFAFSPGRSRLIQALNSKIEASRRASDDSIRDAYVQSGFIVDAYNEWTDVTTLE